MTIIKDFGELQEFKPDQVKNYQEEIVNEISVFYGEYQSMAAGENGSNQYYYQPTLWEQPGIMEKQ